MLSKIYEKHSLLSEKIRASYAKRDTNPKYLDAAIKACEEQIAIAKQVAEDILKGEKHFKLKTEEEMHEQFKKSFSEEEWNEFEGSDHQKAMLESIDRLAAESANNNPGLKNTDASQLYMNYAGTTFDPDIHKSKDDFIIIPDTLGEHTGYKQLCIIREKQDNWQEVIKLAEQAKSEGWKGDWDKRIEKARKKLAKD